MARINFETSLFKDSRFIDLCVHMGSKEKAVGALLFAWIVGQEYWLINQHGIPKPVWKKQKLRAELIQFGFAEDRGDFVYICGSKEQFAWLLERKASGRLGGLKSQENRIKLAQAKLNHRSSNRNPPFSLLPAPSQNPSLSDGATRTSVPDLDPLLLKKKKSTQPAKSTAVWEAYSDQYQFRYSVSPADGAAIRKQMCLFIDRVGAEDAPRIAQFYVKHNHSWYVDKKHDFSFCLKDATKLRTEWLTGRQGTSAEARAMESRQTNANAFSKLFEQAKAEEQARAEESRND